jgi:hypothetical protein
MDPGLLSRRGVQERDWRQGRSARGPGGAAVEIAVWPDRWGKTGELKAAIDDCLLGPSPDGAAPAIPTPVPARAGRSLAAGLA